MENSSKRKRLRAPSPAMVVACIALAIALSGVGYAAIKIPNNSVGTAQLKNNAVSNAKLQGNSVGNGKLQGNSVNGAKVADGSLTGDDVADGSLSGSDVDQSSLDAVDAATLGGFGPDDFLQVPDTGYDSYVASGSAWVDRDGAGRNHVAITYDTTKTTLCTTTGASTGTEAAAYQDVHLPQGAKITTLFIDYRDDAGSTSSNGTITLVRQLLGQRHEHERDDLQHDPLRRGTRRLRLHGGRHAGSAHDAGDRDRRQRELRVHADGEPRHADRCRLLQREDHVRAPVANHPFERDRGAPRGAPRR
jgi:hypothetical protein